MSTDVIRARNRLANTMRTRPGDAEAVRHARANLAAAHIARAIEENGPVLDEDRRHRLLAMLEQTPADPVSRSSARSRVGGSKGANR